MPDIDRGGVRHWAKARHVHETIFHAVTPDVVDLDRELFDGNECQRRKRRTFLDTGDIFVENIHLEAPGVMFVRQIGDDTSG